MNYLGRYGIIYKITNLINNKKYIGQTTKYYPSERFRRHITDSINHRIDTYFSKAINKYGEKAFVFQIIDTANNQEELNRKEKIYIKFYDTLNRNKGYNLTEGGISSGGNTYKYRTEEQMEKTKAKLSKSKMGKNNPNHKMIEQIDLITNETLIFGSEMEAARYHNIKSKDVIRRRCIGEIKKPYRNRYMFKFYNE